MKIITFYEFAAMPAGTIFSYFTPMMCDGLYRKDETIFGYDGVPIDYFEQSLVAECVNCEPPTMGGLSRWGLFEHDQQYAVYEPEDIAVLRSLLPEPT